jgi:hypothetical protein
MWNHHSGRGKGTAARSGANQATQYVREYLAFSERLERGGPTADLDVRVHGDPPASDGDIHCFLKVAARVG